MHMHSFRELIITAEIQLTDTFNVKQATMGKNSATKLHSSYECSRMTFCLLTLGCYCAATVNIYILEQLSIYHKRHIKLIT